MSKSIKIPEQLIRTPEQLLTFLLVVQNCNDEVSWYETVIQKESSGFCIIVRSCKGSEKYKCTSPISPEMVLYVNKFCEYVDEDEDIAGYDYSELIIGDVLLYCELMDQFYKHHTHVECDNEIAVLNALQIWLSYQNSRLCCDTYISLFAQPDRCVIVPSPTPQGSAIGFFMPLSMFARLDKIFHMQSRYSKGALNKALRTHKIDSIMAVPD